MFSHDWEQDLRILYMFRVVHSCFIHVSSCSFMVRHSWEQDLYILYVYRHIHSCFVMVGNEICIFYTCIDTSINEK